MTEKEKKRASEKANNTAVQTIVDTIKDLVNRTMEFERKHTESTHRGHVIEVLNDYLYRVEVQGAVITVPCAIEQVFNKGDTVLVLYPQGNGSDSHIIGKVRSRTI